MCSLNKQTLQIVPLNRAAWIHQDCLNGSLVTHSDLTSQEYNSKLSFNGSPKAVCDHRRGSRTSQPRTPKMVVLRRTTKLDYLCARFAMFPNAISCQSHWLSHIRGLMGTKKCGKQIKHFLIAWFQIKM